ncbi:MAG: hypothetical protein AAF928_05895 [Myxococcota bacterium]
MGQAAMALAACSSLFAMSSVASAEPVVRPGLDGTLVVAEGGSVAGGGRLGLAAGYNLEFDPLLLVPEIAVSGGGYGGEIEGGGFRGAIGMRAGLSLRYEPSLFVRGGYGHDTIEGFGRNGGCVQVGAALDVRLSRGLTLGPALTYDAGLYPGPGPEALFVVHTVALGASVAFWLQ